MRVVAGALGGRTLRAPRGDGTRPTAERVREALFSLLGDVGGARVLDLYAGTGALGIEALSRGAELAVLVESDRDALVALRRNLADLALVDRVRVLPLRVERSVTALVAAAPFDLVLADPPWTRLDGALLCLARLPWAELLSPGATFCCEHPPERTISPPAGLRRADQRRWGDTAVTLFRNEAAGT